MKVGILRPVSGPVKKRHFIAFDIETTPDNRFLCGSVYGGRMSHKKGSTEKVPFWFHSWEHEEFINYMMNFKDRHRYIWVATNLGFDLFAMFNYTEHIKKIKMLHSGTRMIIAKYNRITFADTFNFAKLSVKKMGDMLGIPKLETPKYITEKRFPRHDEYQSIREYNIRDSEVTYRFMEFVQESFNNFGAKIKYTIASTAMDLFKRKYLDRIVVQPSEAQIDEMRLAYYGGRTEAFVRGPVRDIYYYDYNSCFPSVMRSPYPDPNTMRVKIYPEDDESCNSHIYRDHEGVAHVLVSSPDTGPCLTVPFLPVRTIGSKKLIFPLGKWKGWYSHAELRYAESLGYKIHRVYKSYYYMKMHRYFQRYVEDLYSARMQYKAENNPMQVTAKLLMNSLYGKFAQNTRDTGVVHADMFDKWGDDRYEKTLVGDWVFYDGPADRLPVFVNPIFSIYTTAYARIKLYNDFRRIGVENVYYTDTDSIMTDKYIGTSSELGGLKIEKFISTGTIVRPKMYMVDDIVRMKGIKSATAESFSTALDGQPITQDNFIKIRTAVRKGVAVNTVYQVSKNLNLDDDKRVWPRTFSAVEQQRSRPVEYDEEKVLEEIEDRKWRKANDKYERDREKEQQEFFDSDLWDSEAVGSDISDAEFLENEQFFALHE